MKDLTQPHAGIEVPNETTRTNEAPLAPAHGSACPLRLPKITPAMRARYHEWIDADGWTQEAVDLACLLREHCPCSPNAPHELPQREQP